MPNSSIGYENLKKAKGSKIEINSEPLSGDLPIKESKNNLPVGIGIGHNSPNATRQRLFLEDFMEEESVYSMIVSEAEGDVVRRRSKKLSRVEEVVEEGFEGMRTPCIEVPEEEPFEG